MLCVPLKLRDREYDRIFFLALGVYILSNQEIRRSVRFNKLKQITQSVIRVRLRYVIYMENNKRVLHNIALFPINNIVDLPTLL